MTTPDPQQGDIAPKLSFIGEKNQKTANPTTEHLAALKTQQAAYLAIEARKVLVDWLTSGRTLSLKIVAGLVYAIWRRAGALAKEVTAYDLEAVTVEVWKDLEMIVHDLSGEQPKAGRRLGVIYAAWQRLLAKQRAEVREALSKKKRRGYWAGVVKIVPVWLEDSGETGFYLTVDEKALFKKATRGRGRPRQEEGGKEVGEESKK